MRDRTLSQLVRLAKALLDECRQAHAAADAELVRIDERVRVTIEQRAIVLSGAAGLSAQAVADCTLSLDRRHVMLGQQLAEARNRSEVTRTRVTRANKELRSLERLGEIRQTAARKEAEKKLAAEIDDIARGMRWRTAEEDRDEVLTHVR